MEETPRQAAILLADAFIEGLVAQALLETSEEEIRTIGIVVAQLLYFVKTIYGTEVVAEVMDEANANLHYMMHTDGAFIGEAYFH